MRIALWAITALLLAPPARALNGTTSPLVAPDRMGGVYRLVDNPSGLWVWHVRGDGSPATGYFTAQLVDSLHEIGWATLQADGFGGAFVSYRAETTLPNTVRTTRVAPDLAPAPGWALHGDVVASTPVGPGFFGMAPDLAGGLYTAWQDFRVTYEDQDIVMQHVTSQAAPAAGWPAHGVFVCDAPGDQYDPVLTPDPAGGVVAVWWDARAIGTGNDTGLDIWAQSITPEGTMRWATDGVPVTRRTGAQLTPSIVTDGQGGVLVAWVEHVAGVSTPGEGRLGVQRLTSAGNPAAGWLPNGVLLGTGTAPTVYTDQPALVADGQGGAYLLWVESPTDDPPTTPHIVRAQHIAANGIVAAGWPLAGLALASSMERLFAVGLVSDEQGGIIASWCDQDPEPGHLTTQRVRFGGTLAPGWPVGGIVLTGSSGGPISGPAMVEDGSGGATFSWYEPFAAQELRARPRVRRVTHEGVLDPYWGGYPYVDGQPVSSPTPSPGAVTIAFALPTPSSIEARVFDLSGRRVRDLGRVAEAAAGRRTLAWDGRDDDGEALPAGLYFVRIRWSERDHTARVVIAR